MIGTGIRRARSKDFSTSGSTVRKLTQASETCHAIYTSALVQTGTGLTFIDVHLAEVTSEALATLAGETIELINACASILAGTWKTVVPVQVTVLSHPSRLTVTAVTINVVPARAMDAWAAATLIHLRVAVRRLKAIRTQAVKSILFIYTFSSIPAGARCTLIYFHITFGTSEARFANTVIAINAIFADAIVTWIAGTVIKVYLAICTRGSMLALANVLVDLVHTLAPILTRVAVALI